VARKVRVSHPSQKREGWGLPVGSQQEEDPQEHPIHPIYPIGPKLQSIISLADDTSYGLA
jgi:hypothetical protein